MPADNLGITAHHQPLQATRAWEWLLALRYGTDTAQGPLTADAHGGWHSTCPVTPDAHELLDCWMPLVAQTPWVIAQLGQSMDGRMLRSSSN
jgi:hypothetical protein